MTPTIFVYSVNESIPLSLHAWVCGDGGVACLSWVPFTGDEPVDVLTKGVGEIVLMKKGDGSVLYIISCNW